MEGFQPRSSIWRLYANQEEGDQGLSVIKATVENETKFQRSLNKCLRWQKPNEEEIKEEKQVVQGKPPVSMADLWGG